MRRDFRYKLSILTFLLPAAAGLAVVPHAACAVEAAAAAAADAGDAVTPQLPQHRGGILRMTANAGAGTIDPQINYVSQYQRLYAMTTDGLVTFRKTGGDGSMQLVPDLAEAMPEVRDGGTTYVFKLRRGLKFSDGREITVGDVKASLERLFKVRSPNAAAWYSVIAGGDACVAKPASCSLPGVVADPASNTITIHTIRPSAEFLFQLAMPFACVLPADTPPQDLGMALPVSTGAYMFTEYSPSRGMHLKRNPYFREWSRAAQPDGYADEIDYRFGLQDTDAVNAVLRGQFDVQYGNVPLDRMAEIGARYPAQAHINSLPAYYYITMNTRMAPFDDPDLRRAVALAVNRRVIVNLFGGPAMGTPLCQLLPPEIDGYVAYCPYSKPPGASWVAPDLDRARALVARSGRAGMDVTILTSDLPQEQAMGLYLQSVLADIGFHARQHTISNSIFFTYIQNSNNKVQIALTNWYQDYPAPSNFLYVMNSCVSFHPGSDASINMSAFCAPEIDAKMEKALAIGAVNRDAAAPIWAEVNRKLTDAAPITTLFQNRDLNLTSARLGNFVYSKIYHQLYALAWVQ